MPRLEMDEAQEVVPTVQLEPMVEQQVRVALHEYQQAVEFAARAQDLADIRLKKVADALEESGEVGCVVDGIPMTWVFPTKSTLDKKKLLAQGVTFAQIEAATERRPTKEYFRVYFPRKKA